MRFTTLPDSVIADIAERLDYSDVRNLMLTSKRMYIAIKAYKKDKIRFKELNFKGRDAPVAVDHSGQEYKFNKWNEKSASSWNFKRTLESCDSIDNLHVRVYDKVVYAALMNTKAKIGILCIHSYMCVPNEEMLALGKTFTAKFYFDQCSNVFTDEMLTSILPLSTISRHWEVSESFGVFPITDLTLDALVSGNQKTFSLHFINNWMTIEGIVRAFQIHREKYGTYGLRWYFGILRGNQTADAEKYFGEDGELREICTSVSHSAKVNTLIYQICGEDFYIVFALDRSVHQDGFNP